MNMNTAQRLVELNRQFYQTFGKDFSATRGRIQPGVRKIITELKGDENILDLGCGNGELARELARKGHRGAYLGVDFSLPLLQDAESQPADFSATFVQTDLTKLTKDEGRWTMVNGLPSIVAFDTVFCFATLHHIPSTELRLNILRFVHSALSEASESSEPSQGLKGKFILSNWQFLNSEKLKNRIQPWNLTDIPAETVDEGDYLLDWRAGGTGLRYAHHFSEAELESLAVQTSFRVIRSFYSDGENSRLGLYQVWECM